MAVTVLFTSGAKRVVEAADDARVDADYFFTLTKWDERLQTAKVVLTLLASEVVWAEITTEGGPVRRVRGAAAGDGTRH